MKRVKNLYSKICDIENIRLAYKNAKRGKSKYRQVIEIEKNPEYYLLQIQEMLVNKMFSTSEYQIKDIFDGKKKRTIHKLPFFPDRIVHHALIQIIEPILLKSLVRDTFQSIKGRGTSDARKRVSKFFKQNNPQYCLKIDIEKYYPSINNERLKCKIRKKIGCENTLNLIDNIIDSCQGLPIGNYTSQIFGNFYLSEFDHYIKEEVKIKGYFRYCDDMIFLHNDKSFLWRIKPLVFGFLKTEQLMIKSSWKMFNIKQEVDFVGYYYSGNKITLRNSIKLNFLQLINTKINTKKLLSAYMAFWGWMKPINCLSLWNTRKTDLTKIKTKEF